jgi:hypothetical protein
MIAQERLQTMCQTNGYFAPQITPRNTWVALHQFLYTVAILEGSERNMDIGYDRRWCYHDFPDAVEALAEWKERGFAGKPLNYITQK